MAGGRCSALAAACAIAALTACASGPSRQPPTALVESITRSVYADDYAGTTADMDGETKAQVTRADLGRLSDKMHELGPFEGADQTSADPDKGVYEYDLRFASGHMTAKLRIDPSGKVGAYRVYPGAPGPQPTTNVTG